MSNFPSRQNFYKPDHFRKYVSVAKERKRLHLGSLLQSTSGSAHDLLVSNLRKGARSHTKENGGWVLEEIENAQRQQDTMTDEKKNAAIVDCIASELAERMCNSVGERIEKLGRKILLPALGDIIQANLLSDRHAVEELLIYIKGKLAEEHLIPLSNIPSKFIVQRAMEIVKNIQ